MRYGFILLLLLLLLHPSSSYAAICEITAAPVVGDYYVMRHDGIGGHTVFDAGANKFTASQNCTVTAASVMTTSDSGRTDAHVIIYNDSAGSVGSIIETGSDYTVSAYPTYTHATSTFSATTLTSGTTYWIGSTATALNGNGLYQRPTGAGSGFAYTKQDGVWTALNETFVYEIDGTIGGGGGSGSSSATSSDLYATSTVITYDDWLFVNAVIIFLLSLIVFGMFFAHYTSKKPFLWS